MAGEPEVLTYNEVLEILSTQAREGSVTAAAALERALRAAQKREAESFDDELAGILSKS